MQRRRFLQAMLGVGAVGLGYAATRWWPDGNQWRNPCLGGLPSGLANHALVRAAWAGLEPAKVWDMHVHIAGIGDSGSGMRVNPAMDSLAHPLLFAQKRVFMDAACAKGDRLAKRGVDHAYLDRLIEQAAAFPPGMKFMLYAMENFHSGYHVDLMHTGIHVPNAHVRALAQAWPEYFEWVASIHPYRADAVATLEQCVRDGARAVKWLPSAMGIDPDSQQCDAFYAALARLDVPLITHTGTEMSVIGEGHSQDHNNPLRLRRPLQRGVRVVAAHCASFGKDYDWDAGSKPERVSSFSLFARLMDEAGSERLYGDLSALTLANRYHILPGLLQRSSWHTRLLNGSDYPLPGVTSITSLKSLVRAGLLAVNEANVLVELRKYNALLFDFVLKRSLRWQGRRFPASCFETRDYFISAKAQGVKEQT